MSPSHLYLHMELLWSYIKTEVSTGMVDEKVTVILHVLRYIMTFLVHTEKKNQVGDLLLVVGDLPLVSCKTDIYLLH